jgi:hypothetical protein
MTSFLPFIFLFVELIFVPPHASGAGVVIAYSSINPNSSHLEITRAQGFYRKYGIDAENILVRRSATSQLTEPGVKNFRSYRTRKFP